jgi:hypothetical protein
VLRKTLERQTWWPVPLILALKRQKQISEFKANGVYRENFRTARKTLSQENKKKERRSKKKNCVCISHHLHLLIL